MIVRAAVQSGGETHIGAEGERHHHILHRMIGAGIEARRPWATQGFVTDGGDFLDREAAMRHAIECGQMRAACKRKRLFSEDLW